MSYGLGEHFVVSEWFPRSDSRCFVSRIGLRSDIEISFHKVASRVNRFGVPEDKVGIIKSNCVFGYAYSVV